MQLFAPEVTVTDGVGSLSHQPYSVMLRKLANEMIVDGDEEPLASQDLLTLVARIPPLAELVPGNKLGARQLSEWCCEFAFFVRQYPSGLSDAIAEATRIVRSIENDMENWTHKLPRAIAIIQRRDIESTLQQHHIKIHQVCRRWQVRTHSRIEDMDMGIVQMTLRRGLYDEDHVSTMEELSDGPSFDALVDELATEDSQGRFPEALQGLAEVMQEGLGVFSRGDAKRRSLEVNLYGLLQRARGLLPDLELRRGEVNRLDANAFNGTAKYDEYKGRYLSSEEVVIKFFRTYMPSTSGNVTSPDKHQRRFVREAGIWLATWQQDRGKYLVPFYGYCITDTRGPYMVSPYYPQTAENYVKQVIGIDHLGLLRDVAKGLEVLHGMDPQVIHGSVKGSNIFIGRDGTARLGNFGFSKLMEDVMGEPYTATGNAEAEVRWRPPERWQGQGILSVEGDIWEFGMTMLELLTHERPWKEYRHVGQVLSAISAGRRPVRPSDPEVVARGLTDNIWALMEACWKEERDERPKIAEVLRALPAPSGPGDVIMA
ncbi:kinase-like protein [Neolentinus lepideus HHB14362 ss-1]|uniref:Kinase-like protein n=1 Tax=Neolentinus lepideus HHB14362 ss-1 TaxID=1314782 RepID=A0A165QN98_9AGAM|nr:kinase-like protein [Neolentinus lepideus HHB14362 ss-1]